jgi:SAM-dependent methyltransferase
MEGSKRTTFWRQPRESARARGSRISAPGSGGPARYLASRYGALVTGVELTPARVRGANELTRLVGLHEQVQIVEGNVMAAPIPDKSVDVVIGQEALLHIPDRRRAMAEAFRILNAAAGSPSPTGSRRRRSPRRTRTFCGKARPSKRWKAPNPIETC